jgi:hypothetical protein
MCCLADEMAKSLSNLLLSHRNEQTLVKNRSCPHLNRCIKKRKRSRARTCFLLDRIFARKTAMVSKSYPISKTTSPGSASCPNEAPSNSIASGECNATCNRCTGSSGKLLCKVLQSRILLENLFVSSGLALHLCQLYVESYCACWRQRPYALTALQAEKAKQLDLRLQAHSACMKLTL